MKHLLLLLTILFASSFCIVFASDAETDSIWQISEFNDKFGDPTGEYFLSGKFKGDFSNSAASFDDATVAVRLTKEKFDFLLFRYGNNIVKEDEKYKISIKVDQKVYCIITDKYLRIGFADMLANVYDLELSTLQNLLSLNMEMKLVIEEIAARELKETFRFTIPANHGFSKLANEISNFSLNTAFANRNDYTEYYKRVYEKYIDKFAEKLNCKVGGYLNSAILTFTEEPTDEEFKELFNSALENDSLFESITEWEQITYNNRPSKQYIRRKFRYDGIQFIVDFHKKRLMNYNVSFGCFISEILLN